MSLPRCERVSSSVTFSTEALIPFEVMKASALTYGIDPNTLDFDAKEIDDAVFNKDTNRVILRNLMDNGLRDADGQLPGKTIVFARNIDHARLLAELATGSAICDTQRWASAALQQSAM